MSSVRFGLTLKDVLNHQNDQITLAIAGCLVADTVIQLAYWMIKKQSLPRFIPLTKTQIDRLREGNSSESVSGRRVRKNSTYIGSDGFRYIVPTVRL